jgi:DNA adenine methylase
MVVMKVPHPIPYQGSKRNLAPAILRYFPQTLGTLVEPFAGAAAVSMAAALKGKVDRIVLNDINEPLMHLWESIVNSPEATVSEYSCLWQAQLAGPRKYYDAVRAKFNQTHKPCYLLYLLARCVKASIRYNSDGEFNQSPDNRRLGMNPETMRWNISGASRLLSGKTRFMIGDYRQALDVCTPDDLVYMDPPYQGVCKNRDPRYFSLLSFENFTDALSKLNSRRISYIVSYDGRTGEKSYGRPMPEKLGLVHVEVEAGRSSQATLLGRDHITYESIYLSPALVNRIGEITKRNLTLTPKQYSLLVQNGRAETFQRVP